MEEEIIDLIYCYLISPHFVGDSAVCSMRTFAFPLSLSSCQHEFRNVYYVSVEQRQLHDIRIAFLTTEGVHIPFEDSTTSATVLLHFRKILQVLINVYKRGRRHLE